MTPSGKIHRMMNLALGVIAALVTATPLRAEMVGQGDHTLPAPEQAAPEQAAPEQAATDQAPIDQKARDRAPAIIAAFETWLDVQGADRAAIALRHQGRDVTQWARGISADQVVDLASLGKAITGVCVARLEQQGRLTYGQPARDILGFGRAKTPISDFLTHSSGLQQDNTQKAMIKWLDDPTPRWDEVAKSALGLWRKRQDGFAYNNENYAVLGAVVEAATKAPYHQTCQDLALSPAGLRGQPSDRTAAFLPWGGWAMSVADYARFYDYAFGPEGLGNQLGDLPRASVAPHIHYGTGVFQRETKQGRNLWHFGALCIKDQVALGSYAVRWTNGWTLTVWYNACVDFDAMFGLDQALAKAAWQ
jgi:CubicO group peptidase (beta-lactamase class C family)